MPLPVGQIVAFLAIAVPYTLVLTMIGMPFSHTWLWLYLLPPGALAWLVTRPVLEGKRLPELLVSQLRYLSEPHTWCRMAPSAEKDRMVVVARVWRVPQEPLEADKTVDAVGAEPAEVDVVEPGQVTDTAQAGNPRRWPHVGVDRTALVSPEPSPPAPPSPPHIRVRSSIGLSRQLNVVGRVLRASPSERAATPWSQPAVVVPGGHRPGRPDHVQRDQARARLPLPAAAKVVMLGCTAGAGQTTAALLTGQLLASLRGDAVAVVDLGTAGPGSLTERARSIPVLLPSRRIDPGSGIGGKADALGACVLQVITATDAAEDAAQILDSVVARYGLTIADPEAGRVPKALEAANQLVLVAPASVAAADALAMTLDWLEAHDHGRLAATAVAMLNGVSALTKQHVHEAAAVIKGRCRALIRVPWDDQLSGQPTGSLATVTVRAYTALAGVVVTGLADAAASHATDAAR